MSGAFFLRVSGVFRSLLSYQQCFSSNLFTQCNQSYLSMCKQNTSLCSSYSTCMSTFLKCAQLPLLQTASSQVTAVRTTVRCHFPRPSEKKRIKRHGWKTRLSTPAGRRILMHRILKGRHILSH